MVSAANECTQSEKMTQAGPSDGTWTYEGDFIGAYDAGSAHWTISADRFPRSVRIDSPFQRHAPARIGGAPTFERGARTAWLTHPFGKTLIVTAGCGRVQRDGGPIEEIRAGDTLWFEPGERHWHGASPTTAMTHIAIAEMLDGKVVEWMEHVTHAQYGR
jgi:quercetin dioxygenase-like cupin family protein